jgi:UDP-N-acetylglucosamine:LPS N-acetylglucosamine transferase
LRVLVLTASIGAGHDLPAALLAEALAERGVEVVVRDGLEAAGRIARGLVEGASSFDSGFGNTAFDAWYWFGMRTRPGRRLTGGVGLMLAARGLLRCVAGERPDVIVSTYPGSTDVLGRLRRRGRLRVPVVSAITDLAALHFWAHPGVDLHLVTHPESLPEVRAITGQEAVAVRGFNPRGFDDPPSRADARRALDLPADGAVVLVSGGGWGVGDVEGAVEEALAAGAAGVLVLCGTNEGLRARVAERHVRDARVRPLGFTDRMPELMAAADVLVHSTAGLTVLEAAICGCRTISYGWGRGHIRVNNRAFAATGLAAVAPDRPALAAALRDALAHPRERDASWRDLPRAADVVIGFVARLEQTG